jgi:hypothetical protein
MGLRKEYTGAHTHAQRERQGRDREETGKRQGRDREETGKRQGRDREETGKRQGRDREETGKRGRRTYRDAIIPQGTRAGRPAEAHLNVHVLLVHVVQIPEDHVALGLVEPDNPVRHRAVHPQRLPAGRGVDPDQRVRPLDILWPGRRVVLVQVRVRGPVDGVLAVDDLAEVRGQFFVRRVARGPERVAAHGGHGVVVQVRDAGGLALVHQVRVPARRAARFAETGGEFLGLQRGPDDRDAGDAGDLGHLGLQTARRKTTH